MELYSRSTDHILSCFFCLRSNSKKYLNPQDETDSGGIAEETVPSFHEFSIRNLYRYLNSLQSDKEEEDFKDLKMAICEECFRLNGEFNKLYNLLEETKLRLNWCIQKLQDVMTKAKTVRDDHDHDVKVMETEGEKCDDETILETWRTRTLERMNVVIGSSFPLRKNVKENSASSVSEFIGEDKITRQIIRTKDENSVDEDETTDQEEMQSQFQPASSGNQQHFETENVTKVCHDNVSDPCTVFSKNAAPELKMEAEAEISPAIGHVVISMEDDVSEGDTSSLQPKKTSIVGSSLFRPLVDLARAFVSSFTGRGPHSPAAKSQESDTDTDNIDHESVQVLLRIQPAFPSRGRYLIKSLQRTDEAFKRIERYFDNSSSEEWHDIRMKNILRIPATSHSKVESFPLDHDRDYDHNLKKMLFYGTKEESIECILESGVLPPSIGDYPGIFFADRVAKSLDLCGRGQNRGWLFFCEVLLGRVYHANKWTPNLPKHYDSIKLLGRNIPDVFEYEMGEDGCEWPLGKTTKRDCITEKNGFIYNEYIVFSPEQAIPRYLIEWERIEEEEMEENVGSLDEYLESGFLSSFED